MERQTESVDRSSRTLPTALVHLFGALEKPPKTFMSGPVGYYGNRKDEQLTESSSPGEGFLANLAQRGKPLRHLLGTLLAPFGCERAS